MIISSSDSELTTPVRTGPLDIEREHAPVPLTEGLDADAVKFAQAASATNTVVAYDGAWKQFLGWCGERGVSPLPATPETVANYLSARASSPIEPLAASSLRVHLAAIRKAHLLNTLATPTTDPKVLLVMSGIRRSLGTKPASKEALVAVPIQSFVAAMPTDLRGTRDRAMLLLGFAGAFRRSELVALEVDDLRFDPVRANVTVTLRRSKTDQEGVGRAKVIGASSDATLCPVRSLRSWLAAAQITTGPIFRPISRSNRVLDRAIGDAEVAKLAKRVAVACGIDPDHVSGHSLRAGFVTEAATHGAQIDEIQRMTGHRSADVLLGYVRRAEDQKTNMTTKIGL